MILAESSSPSAMPSHVAIIPRNSNATAPPAVRAFDMMMTMTNHATNRKRLMNSQNLRSETNVPRKASIAPGMSPPAEESEKVKVLVSKKTAIFARASNEERVIVCLLLIILFFMLEKRSPLYLHAVLGLR